MPLPRPTTDLARLAPYVAEIGQAAGEQPDRFPSPAVLAAIALRETWAGWSPGYAPLGTHLGWGDKGHGWGLWQADDRTWAAWILSPDALTAIGQARKAAAQLAANLRLLRLALPRQPDDLLQQAAIAGYNARLGAVAAQVMAGANPDAVTTAGPSGKGDYSADVLAKAQALVRAGIFPPWEPTT